MKLLSVTNKGLFCKQANIYIDPWKPVDRAIITHAHSDHARWGMGHYWCHWDSIPVLKMRTGADTNITGLAYGEEIEINGVHISLHPAGHIIGSAQIRLAYQGEVWVFTGDYKLAPDGLSEPFQLVKCDHFITESTFGLPIYQFPSVFDVYQDINQWWKHNQQQNLNTVLLAYSLGKAQNILKHLEANIGEIYLHGAVDNVNQALREVGYQFAGQRIQADTDRSKIKGALIIAPPSAAETPWIKKLRPYKIAMCSGWMQLRGARRRRGVDQGFILSDHCDWAQLNETVVQTGAHDIYVTHGYEAVFARWVRERYNIKATVLKTLFNDEMEETE